MIEYIALAMGIVIGAYLWTHEDIAYCTSCDFGGSTSVKYCPECGDPTVKRQMRSMYRYIPITHVDMPRMEEFELAEAPIMEGTAYIYEDSNSNVPFDKRMHLLTTENDDTRSKMYSLADVPIIGEGGDSQNEGDAV